MCFLFGKGKKMETVKSYKGTDNEMKCKGHSFVIGKDYSVDGDVVKCENGFHACEIPMDVFRFYPPVKNRFFEVEQSGEMVIDETKTASKNIKLTAEIGIMGIVKAQIEWVLESLNKSKKKAATGNSGHAAATGDSGHAAATGYSGHAAATGYSGHAAATGDFGHAAATGNSGHAAATGDFGHAAATGDFGVAASLGIFSKAMAGGKHSWIVICDWRKRRDGSMFIHNIVSSKPGKKIGETTVRINTWYWFENGKLMSEENKNV